MPSLPRLYAILDIDTLAARGLDPQAVLETWLDAGIRLIQLRAKNLPGGEFLELARILVTRARAENAEGAEVVLLINDRADIALMSGADGVHVGQEDLRPKNLRALRALRVIGLSTHNLEQLRAGLDEPADYFAIGPVFPTSTKVHPDPVVGLTIVRQAAEVAGGRPLVAIGGITLATAPAVLAAGASCVAVVSDLLVGDLGRRAREFVAICQ